MRVSCLLNCKHPTCYHDKKRRNRRLSESNLTEMIDFELESRMNRDVNSIP